MLQLSNVELYINNKSLSHESKKILKITYKNRVIRTHQHAIYINDQKIKWNQFLYLPQIYNQDFIFQIIDVHQFGFNPEQFLTVLHGSININKNKKKYKWEVYPVDNSKSTMGFLSFDVDKSKKNIQQNQKFGDNQKFKFFADISIKNVKDAPQKGYITLNNGNQVLKGKVVNSKNGEFTYTFKETNAQFAKAITEKDGVTVQLYSQKGELIGKSQILVTQQKKVNKQNLTKDNSKIGQVQLSLKNQDQLKDNEKQKQSPKIKKNNLTKRNSKGSPSSMGKHENERKQSPTSKQKSNKQDDLKINQRNEQRKGAKDEQIKNNSKLSQDKDKKQNQRKNTPNNSPKKQQKKLSPKKQQKKQRQSNQIQQNQQVNSNRQSIRDQLKKSSKRNRFDQTKDDKTNQQKLNKTNRSDQMRNSRCGNTTPVRSNSKNDSHRQWKKQLQNLKIKKSQMLLKGDSRAFSSKPISDRSAGKRQQQFINTSRFKKMSIIHNNQNIIFSSQSRFKNYINKIPTNNVISYQNLPSMKYQNPGTKKYYRGAAFGFGCKFDFTQIGKNIPGVGQYNLPSIFDRYQ